MKINLFELKKIIRNIIKEDLLSIDRSGLTQVIKKEEDQRDIHSYFDDYIKVENHNNIVIIEVKDLDTKVMREPFFSIKRDEILDENIKKQVDKFPGKIIFIVNSNYFENIGKQLFYKYLRDLVQENQGVENIDNLKDINFNFAFWLLHDIGHSIIDRSISIFDDHVRKLAEYLRDNKFSKRSILQTNIKAFIFDQLEINKKHLKDFYSSDTSDTIQNLVFISYLQTKELENRIQKINLENFANNQFFKTKQINPEFLKEQKHKNNISNMFSNIRDEINFLIEKIKERLKNHNIVTLIGISPEELNNYSFVNN